MMNIYNKRQALKIYRNQRIYKYNCMLSNDLLDDKEFILELMQTTAISMQCLDILQDDKDVVMESRKFGMLDFENISERLRADKEVLGCAIGNQYGTSNNALPFYTKMIQNFSPNEVQIMFEALKEDNIISRRVKNYRRCKNKYQEFACLIDSSTIPTKIKKIYEQWTKNC